LYLAVFIMLFILMITLDPNPNSANASDSFNESAAKFLKFVAGKFLFVSLYFGYKTYRTSKEIRVLKNDHTEMERKLRYLSN
jgi:amino acid permease